MKQGSGNSSAGGRKIEPLPKIVNVKAVSQIGSSMGNKAGIRDGIESVERMHQGRGFSAPIDSGRTVHHGGSQKRHS